MNCLGASNLSVKTRIYTVDSGDAENEFSEKYNCQGYKTIQRAPAHVIRFIVENN